jgi:preprotein translocase subunit SecE
MSTAGDSDSIKPRKEKAKTPSPQTAPDSAAQKRMRRISTYLGEVRTELKKATWPAKPELIAQTQVVLGLLVVIGVFIFSWDTLLGQVMRMVEKALGISGSL